MTSRAVLNHLEVFRVFSQEINVNSTGGKTDKFGYKGVTL